MSKAKLFLLSVIFLSGCSSVPDNFEFSKGAELMVATNLSDHTELYENALLVEKQNLNEVNSTGGSTSDLIVGSGLAGSAIFFADTGVWAGTGSFVDGMALTSFVLDSLTNKGMRHHKWTYNYFFHIDDKCTSRDCVNESLGAFWLKLADIYDKSGKGEKYNFHKFEFSGAGFFFDYFEGKAVQEYTLDDGSIRTNSQNLMLVRQLDDISEYQGKEIWGNDTPKDYQDKITLLGMDYVEETNALIEASKVFPTLYIFRGIDRVAAKEKKPCFGGFFINNGRTINVPETGCMF